MSSEIRNCYECGKRIVSEDELTFEDSDLCKSCYFDKEGE